MLGVLCGLESEAKIARSFPDSVVACSAAVPGKARALARELIGLGADRLMSFGVAGALHGDLPVGALIVGRKVLTHGGTWMCDPAWVEELLRKLPAAQHGEVWGSEFLVPTAVEKIALHKNSACAIVDMESQCAAEIANEAGLPLAVLRVVCDRATHNLPELTMSVIKSDGSIDIRKAVIGALRKPRQIPDLILTQRSMARALKVLDEAALSLARSDHT